MTIHETLKQFKKIFTDPKNHVYSAKTAENR